MSKLSRLGMVLLLIIVLLTFVWFERHLQSEPDSAWQNWQPAGKSADFKIQQRTKIELQLGKKTSLFIVATSDLHGTITSNRILPRPRSRGLLHLAAKLRELRGKHPELLLVDAGDTIQGDPSSFYFSHVAQESSKPLPVIELMNWLKYDALALGNHDFEPPVKILKQNIAQSQFSWLAANVRFRNHDLPLFPPYKVLERRGVRVGILGLITPGVPLWIDPEQIKGLHFEEMLETAKHWAQVLHEEEQVDFLIGLFHSGDNTRYDQHVASARDLPPPNAAGMIADYLPEFDLIISGHAHRISPKRPTRQLHGHQTPLVAPGNAAEGMSTIQVNFEEYSGHWKVAETNYNYLKAEKEADPQLLTRLKPRLRKVEEYLQKTASVFFKHLPNKTELLACGSDLSYAAAKAKAEDAVSLLPWWWHWEKLPTSDLGKPLRREHFFRWLPYDNRIVLVQMFGRQIEIMLESYRRKQFGWYVRSSTILVPGGFSAKVDTTDRDSRLKLTDLAGSALEMEKSYPVWLTNFHWNGGGGLAAKALLRPSQFVRMESVHLRELIFQYLRKSDVILPEKCKPFLNRY
ncbi:MAG: metallophosphoesterase [SAR324 cluster bacterium]|nr:metallophosphoesterase [SAR324 cluster bacterium]MBL7034878.1 metallophosphoesterase [SAR324 cluster bacterium]